MLGLLKKVIGDTNDKELKKMSKYVLRINKLEEQIKALSDSDLKSKTDDFKELAKCSFTKRFRTILLSKVNPFFASATVSSLGAISKSKTSTPILAKWQAIPDPIIPEPITATFFMVRFIIYYFFGQ